MQLASNDVEIKVGRETLYLRPTLRAAFRLEQKYDGFEKLIRAIYTGHLAAYGDVIREGTGQRSALTDYLDNAGDTPLVVSLDLLVGPMCDFIVSLTGDAEAAVEASKGSPISFKEYHTKLYRLATGWLGWPPAAAWEATPAEILEAYQGRTEMLASIFGGKKEGDENTLDATKGEVSGAIRAELNALGNLTKTTMAEVRG
ncbi:hypothetical protein [Tardiphaga sp.]|uniref:hypothetical protein n=1 Tax=Tardiphaga sp. TaxID=1926292 RepID=UPI002623CFA2|nr:hypothetical protein [Tardiphaga sp.]MDB5616163.1 hypothetical protein [Tardiphaga sp.]